MLEFGRSPRMANKESTIAPKLTESEQDLLAYMAHGYILETNSLVGRCLHLMGQAVRPCHEDAINVVTMYRDYNAKGIV